MKRFIYIVSVFFLFAATIAACTNADKAPAELAVKTAEQAVNEAKAEIGKVAPEEVTALESALASVKDKLSKEEYKAALAEAHALINKSKDAIAAVRAKAEAAKAKIAELNLKWTELIDNLPKAIDAVQTKIDKLSKVKKLPKKISTEQFAEAKTAFAMIKEDWVKGQESFKAGKIEEAVSLATSVKEKLNKVMEILGMQATASETPKN